jgi:putative acetyltransferase
MPRTQQQVALRPFLPEDAALLAQIYRASIEELTSDDYSEVQQQAWASQADDEEEFGTLLSGQLTLLGTVDGSPVAFASLKDNEQVEMLYVHPAVARQGVATTLLQALEKLAGARGAKRLRADVSDSAHDFFKRNGFVAQQRNSVPIAGEWLANTTMEKKLTGQDSTQ